MGFTTPKNDPYQWTWVNETDNQKLQSIGYGRFAKQNEVASQAAVDQQTKDNRPNIDGAFTNQQWSQDPNTGEWTLSQGFSGQLGGINNELQQDALNQYSSPMMTGDAARQQAIDAAYTQAQSRLDPRFRQQEEQLRSRLANQGLDPNSPAYQSAMREFEMSRNDAYTGAMNSAIGQGTAAGDSVFNQNLAARNNSLGALGRMRELLGTKPDFNAAGQRTPGDYYGSLMDSLNRSDRNAYMDRQQAIDFIKGGAQLGSSVVGSAFSF